MQTLDGSALGVGEPSDCRGLVPGTVKPALQPGRITSPLLCKGEVHVSLT